MSTSYLVLTVTLALMGAGKAAHEIRVAVASNFTGPAKAVAEAFEAATGHVVVLVPGSTGKHYAQIKNGAPFDVFLAADTTRPERLERDGVALLGTRFTYAIGRLVLWSPRPGYVDPEGDILARGDFRYLAIANAKLAPYGAAAEEVLRARGVWDALGNHLIRGENIGQIFHFVKSGNAELGFVAFSQLARGPIEGSWWDVPRSLYSPVEQQAVLLTDNESARDFLLFVRGNTARQIIQSFGYETP